MKKNIIFLGLLGLAIFLFSSNSSSQNVTVQTALRSDVSLPLREMKPAIPPNGENAKTGNKVLVPNKFKPMPTTAAPDEVIQTENYNNSKAPAVAPIVNFEGTSNLNNISRVTPPDPAGDVGPNHYVQVVNSMLQIFSKTGTSLYGPVQTSTLWAGFSGPWDGHNNGDGIVLYDENADRWLISQFAINCGTYPNYTQYEMIAISTTGDPLGTYYRYAFQYDYMPDYPKIGVWQDGYYMAINRFNTNTTGTPYIGAGACVMERSKMLIGDANAKMVYFKTETLGGSGSSGGANCWAMMPSDCDGTFPAEGTPNYFAYIDGNNTAELRLWALHPDWTTTSNSTFTYVTKFTVSSYTGMGSGSVPELGTLSLDGLGDRLMFRNQYRNFGSYETFVTCHTVNTGSSVAGIRWYEYRKTGSTFSLYQQSTFAPGDGKSRWMASIAMNAIGDIGLAYSVSSSSMYPSIWFTGRKATDPLNQMTIPEGIIQTGTVSMTTYSRWGDYTALNVDPVDNKTFWTTQQYVGTYGGWCPWSTKIASFKFASTPIVTTLAASNISTSFATLNGVVNPNGLATTYYFEWGTTAGYGNVTPTISAGSGSSNLNVNADITGLTEGTPYHFRLVATNIDGTLAGNDLIVVPGGATITTTPASMVTTSSAITGGDIAGDGGSAIIARGVCWSTSTNPTISNNHTSDGSGTGTFTSSITGLAPMTVYHIRAYATNANGTFYGNDLTFTTLCGIVSSFPWNEGFENSGSIPNCWTQEQVNSSGVNWVFVAGNGASNPSTAHTGSYNACLKDNTTADNITRLITPPINLAGLIIPTLTFWHTQAVSLTRQDQLLVYYKTSLDGTWTLLASYTTSITSWTQRTISLPNGSSEYYICFQGNAKRGYGVCVDDVSITGTTPTLSVTPSDQSVGDAAGNTTFNVSSNTSWTVASDQTWCTPTASGSGNGTISAAYTLNTSNSPRVVSLTVSVSGLTPVVVTVTQAGAPCNTPTAFAGNDATILDNENLQLSGVATNFSNVLWTSSGNGNFDAPEMLNTTYYPGNLDIENSSVQISLNVSQTPPCILQASDNFTLTIQRQQMLDLPAGWSGFSSYIVPLNTAFDVFMAPVNDDLVMAKTMTQVYWPDYGINTIGNFDVHQGYVIKMESPGNVPVTGFKSNNSTINLVTGWNIIPVISNNEVGYQEIINQLGANLIIMTEIAGTKILWPAEGVYSLVALSPGKAYFVKVATDCTFTFPQ